ncbi:hypothetical protein [Syntrophotalea acetylenivorans]|uniref:hypothetical protein n=1 Tax=Syntrophotalea acetylenivorans TaxID=1842532 RepID=UPI000B15A41B|nr:hypothetical protein [Syntrophotalea acetylenivorans]
MKQEALTGVCFIENWGTAKVDGLQKAMFLLKNIPAFAPTSIFALLLHKGSLV